MNDKELAAKPLRDHFTATATRLLATLLIAGLFHSARAATPETLIEQVHANGARAVLDREYSNEERWRDLIHGVESGSDAWLQVAAALYAASDAGASEELESAVGEALAVHPSSVFRIAYPAFDASRVCGEPDRNDDRYRSESSALRNVDGRIAAVERIRDVKLASAKKQCLDSLRASRVHLARPSEQDVDDRN